MMAEEVLEICPFTCQALPSNPAEVAYIYNSAKALGKRDTKDEKGSEGPTLRKTKHLCGHNCSLDPLMDYLFSLPPRAASPTASRTRDCPVCQASPVVAVADGGWDVWRKGSRNDADADPLRYVLIRYGKLTMGLSVATSSMGPNRAGSFFYGKSLGRNSGIAQERISQVLRLKPSTIKVWCTRNGRFFKCLH
jgi:hypothetical protein